MNVVRHHNECVEFDVGEPAGEGPPFVFGDGDQARVVEQELPTVGTNGDEVRACRGVVVIGQAGRAAVSAAHASNSGLWFVAARAGGGRAGGPVARGVGSRPRGVRSRKPSWIRYGS